MINDEEKRKERAKRIIESLNDNKIDGSNISISNNNNTEYQSRIDRANNLINSINPPKETSSFNKDNDFDNKIELPKTELESEPNDENIEENKESSFFNKASYIGRRTASGVASGITGIGQAGLTDMADNLQKGKNKSIASNIAETIGVLVNPIGYKATKLLDTQKKMLDIIKDKNSTLIQKVANVGITATSDALDSLPTPTNEITQLVGKVAPNLDQKVLDLNNTISKPVENWKRKLAEESENYGVVTNTLGDVGEVVGNMVPAIAVSVATQGAGVQPSIAQAASLATMGISAKGQSTQEALSRGADLEQAVKIGDTKGMIEVGTEMLTGGVNIFGKGALDDLTGGIVNKVNNKVARFFAKQGFDIAGETLEETISDILGTVIDKGTIDPEANYSFKDWGKTAIETTLSTLVLNVLTGGMYNDVIKLKNEPTVFKDKVSENDIGITYTTEKGQNGENIITPNFSISIENPNRKINVSPTIIKNNRTNAYNVVDANTGIYLDTAFYDSIVDAKEGFSHKAINLSNEQIESINYRINTEKAELNTQLIEQIRGVENNVGKYQQNDTIEQNSNQNEDINQVENKTVQNGNIEEINNNNSTDNRSFEDMAFDAISDTEVEEITSPLENRDIETIGKQTNVNAYQYDNPEVKPYFQEMAQMIGEDLAYISSSENRSTAKGGGTKLNTTTEAISTLHNEMGYSYDQISKGLQNIIDDNGKENNAISKKLELIIDEQLRNGYTNALGKGIAPNQDYINTITARNQEYEKQKNIEVNDATEIEKDNSNKPTISDDEIRNIVKYNQDGKEIKDTNYVDFMVERYKDNINISDIETDTVEVVSLLQEKLEEAKKIVKNDDEKKIRNKQKDLIVKELYKKIKDTKFINIKKLQNEDGSLETKKMNIEISITGLKESFNKSINNQKLAVVPYLDILIKTSNDGIIRNESKDRRNIDEWYYLYNTAIVDNELYSVKIDIKKTQQGDRFYVHRLNIIKEGSSNSESIFENDTMGKDNPSLINNIIPQNQHNVKSQNPSKSTGLIDTASNNNMQKAKKDTNIQDFGEKIGGARKDNAIPRGTKKATKEVIHDYTVNSTDNGYSVDFKGKTLQDGFKNQEEAEKYILDFKENVKSNLATVEKSHISNEYIIKIRNPRTLKTSYTNKKFSNLQDAESYAMALSMYLKEHGKSLFRPQIQKVERLNANSKNATKATGDNILNDFGFKGGEFGNWVTQSERQQFLNYAQDAFTDLATALNIQETDLGQNGDMNIAFGARGKGLSAAVAHFEPAKKVINMTRLKGAGSLAHEYGHSIDNWISRLSGNSDGMATENNYSNKNLSDNMKTAIREVTDAMRYNVSTNEEEINKKNEIFEKSRKEHLEYHLKYLDKVFTGEATKYKRIKGKYETVPIEVTEQQKKQYENIKNTLINGKLEGEIKYEMNSSKLKTEKIYPKEIDTIQKMYKEVVGRKIDDDTLYWLFKYGKPAKQLTEVKSESAYMKSAKELDDMTGRKSLYYSRIDEMWARAFEAYVLDKLKAKGIVDTYLVHSVNNSDYALFNPFPAGEERQNINKAFDNLIQTMKDEGILHDKKSTSSTNNTKQDDGTRYMKKSNSKNKESKQALENKFKELTGDSIIRAEAKLAGIELRNMQRQNGSLDGKIEENPYSKEAMSIYNKYNNNKKSSSYLYHSTATENLQNIIENGLTIGNKQNQEGISSKDKLYLSATEELAQSFAPNDSITFRIKPNAKLENLSSDLLGGEGSYSITNNIPANMLQIKENGKWVNLLDSQIDYTDNKNLTKDIFDKYNITHSENSVDDKRFSEFYNKYKSDYDDWNNSSVEYQKQNGILITIYLNYENNLVKLTTTKEGNKLYIDELYVEKQKQGTGTKIVEALKDYAEKANLTIETNRELSTAKDFWNKVLRKKSGSIDSEGRTLSKEQQEFFRDSKIRDAEGNLLVMYHGTEANVGIPEEYKFTVFDEDKQGSHGSWFGNGFYFTDDKNHAKDYAHSKGDIYEVYLNITNPYEPSYNINTNFYEEYLDKFDKILKEKFSEEAPLRPNTIKEVLKTSGFDGIKIGNTVVAFNSNQIKNVTNTNPTSNKDIRFLKGNVVNENKRNAERTDAYIEQEIKKLEKTGDWDYSIPATSLTDIRKTIEDYLGLGIKKGHFRQSAYGIYKSNRDVIRTTEFKDMDSILHETGHALDLGNRLKLNKESIANELFTAIDKLGGYEGESRTVRLEEGFAEVIREYSIIPEQAEIDYPQSVAVIEELRNNDKSFDDFISKVQEQTYNYIHQNPQNRVHSNISIGEQTDKTPLTKAWLKQEIMRNIWDKDYVVKEAVKGLADVKGKTVNQLKASDNAYYLTRLASGISDKVTSMLADGYIDENGNKLMPGLNKVGEILGDDPQRYNDLRDYLVAKRDTEYKAKTLKTGIRSMDTKYVLNKFKNDTQIKQAANVIYKTLDGVMQYAVKNGLITEETVQNLKESNAFYVPMQRVIEGRGNQTGRKGAVSDIIKKRTGSELDVKDVLENIVANSSNIIQQVENNNVLKALYNQGEEAELTGAIYDVIPAPMIKIGTANLSMWENELKNQGVNTNKLDLEKTIDLFVPNKKVDTKNLITSFINDDGKRIYLQFNDEVLFNSLMNLDSKLMSDVLKINSKINLPLRYGATMANIGFAIPNMISDTAQASIYSNAGFIPVVDNALGVLDVLTAKNKYVKDFVNRYSPEYVQRIEKMYSIYKQTGSTSSTRLSQYRESTQNVMKDVYGTKNSEALGIHEKFKPLKRLLDILTYIPELSEQSTRFRVFEKNYDMYKDKGNSEMDSRILAALESRDATQDFGRTGNLTREINQLIPFSAARVGSSYTFAEKVKANPKQTAMRIAMLTALAIAIKGIGYDDDEIEELNQRKKDDNFVLKIGNNVVTIKKPQGILRSMINLAEYIQDLATGHIDEGKEGERLGEWITNAIMDNMPADSVTGLVPNMVAPLIENAINKDFYYNTDIVKSYDLDLPDSEQYYDYNSQLAILLGKSLGKIPLLNWFIGEDGYSPAKIDNLISGYFAGLGTQVTNIMDYVSGKIGLSPEKPEMGAESNAIGKRFIVNVNTNSASIDEVYNRKTELTKKQNGGTITADEETELETLKGAITNLSKVNKQIKEIKADLTTSGKEKAEQIKVLQQQKTDIARQALGKDLIHSENASIIETTTFYPTNSSLSKNNYKLELSSEMKKEYAEIAQEYYSKYENQGLYSQDKLKEIKTKAKEYAKNSLMQKYRSQLVKTK